MSLFKFYTVINKPRINNGRLALKFCSYLLLWQKKWWIVLGYRSNPQTKLICPQSLTRSGQGLGEATAQFSVMSEVVTSPSLYSESRRFFTSPFHLVSFEDDRKNISKDVKKLKFAMVKINPTTSPGRNTQKHGVRLNPETGSWEEMDLFIYFQIKIWHIFLAQLPDSNSFTNKQQTEGHFNG